ncbi:MAG TPA: hypothetical protein VKY38_07960 [Azoarcus sp.]|nr:hypothetical protein [Azoarcus sp.]
MNVRLVLMLGLASLAATASAQTIQLECGGVGLDDSERRLAEQPHHALTVIMATTTGSYISGVQLAVEAPLADKAAENSMCGPVGQVDVTEAGRYRVSASYGDETREQWVELTPGGGKRLVMTWPD